MNKQRRKFTEQELIDAVDQQLLKQKQELRYIENFIYAIRNGCFDKQFLELLFGNEMIAFDIRMASRDIIEFIKINRHRWSKF